jgi:hypothetical protein
MYTRRATVARRRPGAGWLHVVCASLMLASLAAEPAFYYLQRVTLASTSFYVWFVVRKVVSVVYPLFLLVWFLRPAIRSQVAQWPRPGRAGIIPAENERGS